MGSLLGLVTGKAKVWLLLAAGALAVVAFMGWVSHKERAAYQAGNDAAMALWAQADLKRAAVALEAEQAARAEETRRTAAQKEAADAYEIKMAHARADAAAADAAAGRLRGRVAELVAAARGGAGSEGPAPADPGTTADDAAGMLAELQRRADERAGILAVIADERGAAGQLCQAAYDSLTAERTP